MPEQIHLVPASILAGAIFFGDAFGVDIHACIDKAGNKKFQTFPCEMDSWTVERKMVDEAGRRPASVPSTATQKPKSGMSQVTLQASPNGHFFAMARINDTPVRALIDTGATTVSMNREDASSMGIDYLRGRRVTMQTANGPTGAYVVTLARVEVGDIVLTNVAGTVTESGRYAMPFVLIGMSFLREVDMRRTGTTMVLQRIN
jgi:clan AA aspartic protease (TIGR02281 family)